MAAPAVLKTLEQAWQALEPLNLPMAVAGGLALSAWKYPRSTRDVDLVVQLATGRVEVLLGALTAKGFRARHTPAVQSLGETRIIQFEFDPAESFVTIPTDLLLVDSAYHHVALERKVPFSLSGISAGMFVLSCEDLVLHKLLAGRLIDRSDAAALMRANRPDLQVEYLRQWAARLQLERELSDVWREACPNEPPP